MWAECKYWNWLWSGLLVKLKIIRTFLRLLIILSRKISFSELFHLKLNAPTIMHRYKNRQTSIHTQKKYTDTFLQAPSTHHNSDTLLPWCKISRCRVSFTHVKFTIIFQHMWETKEKGELSCFAFYLVSGLYHLMGSIYVDTVIVLYLNKLPCRPSLYRRHPSIHQRCKD